MRGDMVTTQHKASARGGGDAGVCGDILEIRSHLARCVGSFVRRGVDPVVVDSPHRGSADV